MDGVCPTCGGVARYGNNGVRERCIKHALEGMKYIDSRKCVSCTKQPVFGERDGKATHCAEHKLVGMVDVRSKRCELCSKRPSFGLVWGQPLRCEQHKTDTMTNVVSKRCLMCNTQQHMDWSGISRHTVRCINQIL